MLARLVNSLLYAGVWLLVLERLWLGVAFVFQDLRFLLFQRSHVRRRIAGLVLEHGAATGKQTG